jgi:drug/metabolite transporter (DMT)-like permease
MNAIFPLCAAVLQSTSFILDKVILSVRGVGYRTYTVASYPLMFLLILIAYLALRPPLATALLSGRLLWLFLFSVVLSLGTNLLYYRALDDNCLGEIQLLDLLGYPAVIMVSAILFPDERNVVTIIAAFTASMTVLWCHWERHRLAMGKAAVPFVLWSLAAAPSSASVSKLLLQTWNPISLMLVQSGVSAVVLAVLYGRQVVGHFPQTPRRSQVLVSLVVTNVLTTLAFILLYFSYARSGIVYTTLLCLLQPVLVYVASVTLLKEKVTRKKSVAFVVVLVAILLSHVRL